MHFYISHIANFISIQIARTKESKTYNQILKHEQIFQELISLTVSPSDDQYNHLFIKIEVLMKEYFEGSKFLPYTIEKTILDALIVPHTITEINNIGDAFFVKNLPDNKFFNLIGDPNYGSDLIG